MKTTLVIDDELFSTAQKYSGLKNKAELITAALKVFVQKEAAKRLAAMGGKAPKLKPFKRTRHF